jgi:hypothetical protein
VPARQVNAVKRQDGHLLHSRASGTEPGTAHHRKRDDTQRDDASRTLSSSRPYAAGSACGSHAPKALAVHRVDRSSCFAACASFVHQGLETSCAIARPNSSQGLPILGRRAVNSRGLLLGSAHRGQRRISDHAQANARPCALCRLARRSAGERPRSGIQHHHDHRLGALRGIEVIVWDRGQQRWENTPPSLKRRDLDDLGEGTSRAAVIRPPWWWSECDASAALRLVVPVDSECGQFTGVSSSVFRRGQATSRASRSDATHDTTEVE